MPTFSWLVTARVVGGIGVGMASNVVPLYISEISPAKIRGRLVTFYQLAVTLGILVAYLTNAFLLNFSLTHQQEISGSFFSLLFVNEVWRGMISIEILPALLLLAGLTIVPESPRRLIQKGKTKEGTHILSKLTNETDALYQVKAITGTIVKEKGSYRELLVPGMHKALLVAILSFHSSAV